MAAMVPSSLRRVLAQEGSVKRRCMGKDRKFR